MYVSVAYALTVKKPNIHYSYLNLSQLSILRKENKVINSFFFFKGKKKTLCKRGRTTAVSNEKFTSDDKEGGKFYYITPSS